MRLQIGLKLYNLNWDHISGHKCGHKVSNTIKKGGKASLP